MPTATPIKRTHADPAVAGFDVSSAIGDLGAFAQLLEDEIPLLVEHETEQTRLDAERHAPVGKTRRYRTAIRSRLWRNEDGSVAGSVFVIQLPWIRNLRWQRRHNANGTKLWPKNLPLWLEYGTAKTNAHPHLIPAFEAGKRRVDRVVEYLLQRAGRGLA